MSQHSMKDISAPILNKQPVQITPEMENKMRLIANLIIDRIFEDKKNNTLKFTSNSNRLQDKDNRRVIKERNTT